MNGTGNPYFEDQKVLDLNNEGEKSTHLVRFQIFLMRLAFLVVYGFLMQLVLIIFVGILWITNLLSRSVQRIRMMGV